MAYRRASKKQLELIASLTAQLGIINPTLYSKHSVDQASRLIAKYFRQLKKQQRARQLKLL